MFFIVIPFTKTTRLAVVAEANLHCGDFLFEKSCRHSTGSFSFFLVFTTKLSLIFLKCGRKSCRFGLIMPCLLLNGTWECLIIDFSFFSVESCLLCVFHWCGFSRYKFFHFWSVSGWFYHFDVLIFVTLFNSNGAVAIALANLCWSVFFSIKLSQIGSFH